MLTDNRADYRPQEWFLIACDGDLVLKLAHDLLIGEDERGQTVLSPARENALLGITSENGRLTLQALAMEWTFSENGGLSVQHLTFVQGLSLKLDFPNSELIITPDYKAGTRVQVDREIQLRPTETPTVTLSRVDEPITIIEPAPEEFAESSQAASDAPDGDISIEEVTALLEAANETDSDEVFVHRTHDVPDEVVPVHLRADDATAASTISSQEIPVLTETVREISPLPEPVVELAPDPVGKVAVAVEISGEVPLVPLPSRSRHRVLGGLIAAAALLAPMYFFVTDGGDVGVDFPLSNYRSATETTAAIEVTTETPMPGAEETPNQNESPKALLDTAETLVLAEEAPTSAPARTPGGAPAAGTGSAESITASLPGPADLPETDRLLIDSLLAEAKAYYDAGAIVTPVQANAVSNLTQVLHMDPKNEEGLRLMYLSAVRLIDEAEIAHDAGDHYLARNLVEDVLGFHPEFRDARNLLDSWTRAPGS